MLPNIVTLGAGASMYDGGHSSVHSDEDKERIG